MLNNEEHNLLVSIKTGLEALQENNERIFKEIKDLKESLENDYLKKLEALNKEEKNL